MNRPITAQVETALGANVASVRSVSGGDINEAHVVELSDARRVFIKTNDRAPAGMFAAEARGLAWLREANALRIPAVIATSDQFLALEWVMPAPAASDYDERFGRGLAALHRFGVPSARKRFGLDHDNFIGRLPQSNTWGDSWTEFYRTRRLLPQLQLATDAGHIPTSIRRRFDDLFAQLEQQVGPAEPPSRLHGDLWSGNKHVDERGEPCIIDPAAYGGHREVDLAMMRLFGGFGPRVFDAYQEAFPLADGWRQRVSIYQVYPLLVHVNLFGTSYLSSLASSLESSLASAP